MSECNAWNNGSHNVTMRGANLRTIQNTEDERKMKKLGSLVTLLSCCINQSWKRLSFLCEIVNGHYLSQLSRRYLLFSQKHELISIPFPYSRHFSDTFFDSFLKTRDRQSQFSTLRTWWITRHLGCVWATVRLTLPSQTQSKLCSRKGKAPGRALALGLFTHLFSTFVSVSSAAGELPPEQEITTTFGALIPQGPA